MSCVRRCAQHHVLLRRWDGILRHNVMRRAGSTESLLHWHVLALIVDRTMAAELQLPARWIPYLRKDKPGKMSLNTLLEAAKFLEQQEQKKQQQEQKATMEAALVISQSLATTAKTTPVAAAKPPVISNQTQTVVITTTANILQAPITLAAPVISKAGHRISTTVIPHPKNRVIHNSFDIMNPLIIDEKTGEIRRKQPPMVFRAGTREVHNKLEKHRRAHLKECFDALKKQLPANQDEKKISNLNILHSAEKYIQLLKRKEKELEHEMERLARAKIAYQQKIAVLKKEISPHFEGDISKMLPQVAPPSPVPEIVIKEELEVEPIKLIDPAVSPPQSNGAPSGPEKVAIPILSKSIVPQGAIKEVSVGQPVQAAQLSVVPVTYPVNPLVLQKLVMPKGLTDLAPLVQTHFITTTPQQINGKVVPLTQYLVKPVVVVSTPSPRPS